MRIGIITSSYSISRSDARNAGVFVRDIASTMASFGHEISVLTPWTTGTREPERNVSVDFFPWLGKSHDIASKDIRNPMNLIKQSSLILSGMVHIRKFITEHNPQALLAMWAIPSGLFCWHATKRMSVPYGVWVLGSDIWNRNKYPFGDRIVKRILADAEFRFADGIQLANEVKEITNLPCSFVPSSRNLPVSNRSGIKVIKNRPIQFLFIGRYELNKGPDILIDAMKILADSGESYFLRMFGGGSLKQTMVEQVRGYEDFIMIGDYATPREVVDQMSDCDWLVIPSRIESIPLILSDAVQARIPIVATEVGDLKYLFENYKIGITAPSPNPSELATAMKLAASTDRETFNDGLRHASGFFDLNSTASEIIHLLSEYTSDDS